MVEVARQAGHAPLGTFDRDSGKIIDGAQRLLMPFLFSYGTLQQADVQMTTFGRLLQGQPDELVGFEQGVLEIDDPQFVAESGMSRHAIVTFNGRHESRVRGTVFELSDHELASADDYEPAGYMRVSTILASGREAWVYADARFGSVPRPDPT